MDEVPQSTLLSFGVSQNQLNSETVLFVLRASRFTGSSLQQQTTLGLTVPQQAGVRLPQTHNYLFTHSRT
ncbi:MAG: hypothetical protein ACRC1Z_24075 [Waterburya sp.]